MVSITETEEAPTVVTISGPAEAALMGPAAYLEGQIAAISINSPGLAEEVSQIVNKAIDAAKRLHEDRMELTRPLDELKDRWIGKYRPAIDRFKRIADTGKGKLQDYTDRIRREREAAEAKAEADRQREQQRLNEEAAKVAADAKKRADEAMAASLAAREAGDVGKAAKLEERAQGAILAGHAKVESIMAMPAVTHAIAAPAVPKIAGFSERTTYDAKLVDKVAALQFCAANPAFQHLFKVDETALRSLARSMKEAFRVDGFTLVKGSVAASRAA